MQFSDMQAELADRVGAYDSTVAADSVKLKRWLNLAQQDITSRQNWPFMLYHEIVQTVADITTGTVSINSGSAALTFSSAPAVSVTDWFIKFSTGDSWYRVSSHTAASTSATLTQTYGESSNLSAGTYTLRKVLYSTSTPLDSILDIKRTVDGMPLKSVSSSAADLFLPLYWDSGTIYGYISSIPETDGDLRFSLIYSPSSVENLQVRGIKRLAYMVDDDDVSVVPVRWHSTVLDMASFYAFTSLDDTRTSEFFNKAELGMKSMAETFDYDLGRTRLTRSLTGGTLAGPAYMLPPQYGVNQ